MIFITYNPEHHNIESIWLYFLMSHSPKSYTEISSHIYDFVTCKKPDLFPRPYVFTLGDLFVQNSSWEWWLPKQGVFFFEYVEKGLNMGVSFCDIGIASSAFHTTQNNVLVLLLDNDQFPWNVTRNGYATLHCVINSEAKGSIDVQTPAEKLVWTLDWLKAGCSCPKTHGYSPTNIF